jgi:hypothetical protein
VQEGKLRSQLGTEARALNHLAAQVAAMQQKQAEVRSTAGMHLTQMKDVRGPSRPPPRLPCTALPATTLSGSLTSSRATLTPLQSDLVLPCAKPASGGTC